MNIIIILISVVLNAMAQICLKIGAKDLPHHLSKEILLKMMNVPIAMGFMCYGLSILLWISALSKVEVSVAYPFQALGFVVVLLTSYFFLNETLTMNKLLGFTLIISGVYFISRA